MRTLGQLTVGLGDEKHIVATEQQTKKLINATTCIGYAKADIYFTIFIGFLI